VKAFVTGGSGFVGQNLIRMLVGAGHEVRALARSGQAEEAVLAAGAIAVPGSLLDFKALRAGMTGCDTIFHSAAVMEFFGHHKEMEEVNVHGTRCIVEASRASGVPRLVFISAAAVISNGQPVINADESRPYPARVFGVYSRTKAEAEKLVLAANAPGFVTVAVRPPGIWGAGDINFLPNVVSAVKRGQFVWVNHGNYPYSMCHVRNVCEGAVLAAGRGRGGEAYFVTDGDPAMTFRQLLTDLLATQGVTPGSTSLPRWFATGMAAAFEMAWHLLFLRGGPPITRAHLALIGGEVTVSDAKARRELGYTARVSREAGLAELSALHSTGEG